MKRRAGFTLIELLVATAMLAMLASAGFAALTAGTRSATKAKGQGRMIAHGQAALQGMVADIRAAVAHEDYRLTSLDAEYEGMDADTIDFIVSGRGRLFKEVTGGRGRCEVGYYIENSADTEAQWLVRREAMEVDEDPLSGGAISLAGPYVAAMNLEFYDGLFWQAGWDDQEEFPDAVSIRIVVVDEDDHEAPMVFSTSVQILAQ